MSYRAPNVQTISWIGTLTSIVRRIGCSFLGSTLGYIIGSQSDILFSIDTGIIGVGLGASIGTLIPFTRNLGILERMFSAGIGVIITVLIWIDPEKTASEVIWGMAIAAGIFSIIATQIFNAVQHYRKRSS